MTSELGIYYIGPGAANAHQCSIDGERMPEGTIFYEFHTNMPASKNVEAHVRTRRVCFRCVQDIVLRTVKKRDESGKSPDL